MQVQVIMPLYLAEHLGWGQAQFSFLFIAQGVVNSSLVCWYPALQARLTSFGVQALAAGLLTCAHVTFFLAPLAAQGSHAGVPDVPVQGFVAAWLATRFGVDPQRAALIGLVVFATLLRALGVGLNQSSMGNSLSHLAGESVLARVMALNGMSMDFTRIVFPPVVGFIYDYGHELPFAFTAACALGALVFALLAKLVDDKLEAIAQAPAAMI